MSTANQAETLPVQPKKPRFYYGWIIVVVSALTRLRLLWSRQQQPGRLPPADE